MEITPPQLRAARALVGWSQQQLAEKALVGVATIRRFEAGASQGMGPLQQRGLRQALEAAGVVFIDRNGAGPGVRLKDPNG